jgi:hypothetical protein
VLPKRGTAAKRNSENMRFSRIPRPKKASIGAEGTPHARAVGGRRATSTRQTSWLTGIFGASRRAASTPDLARDGLYHPCLLDHAVATEGLVKRGSARGFGRCGKRQRSRRRRSPGIAGSRSRISHRSRPASTCLRWRRCGPSRSASGSTRLTSSRARRAAACVAAPPPLCADTGCVQPFVHAVCKAGYCAVAQD